MPFYVCNQVYKFWGRIWGQGNQKWGFWVKNWKFPKGNNQNRETCSGVTRCGKLHKTDTHVLGHSGHSGQLGRVQTDSFDVIKCI